MKLVMELTEDEIKGLYSFVKTVKSIPMIEAVYAVPFISLATNREQISIVSIRNNTDEYNKRIFGFAKKRDLLPEEVKLRAAMDKLDESFYRFYFIEEGVERYSLPAKTPEDVISERALASGTILYDRFGNITTQKKIIAEVMNSLENVVPVENFAEVSEMVRH